MMNRSVSELHGALVCFGDLQQGKKCLVALLNKESEELIKKLNYCYQNTWTSYRGMAASCLMILLRHDFPLIKQVIS